MPAITPDMLAAGYALSGGFIAVPVQSLREIDREADRIHEKLIDLALHLSDQKEIQQVGSLAARIRRLKIRLRLLRGGQDS